MKIAIIGVGSVGEALAKKLVVKGHSLLLGTRDTQSENMKNVSYELGRLAGKKDMVSLHLPADAAANADIVILSTPWPATESVVRGLGTLQGKILIDCTNPLRKDLSGLDVAGDTSGAEKVAEWAGKGVTVVKAFNTVGFNVMLQPEFGDRKAIMYYCGDDQAAKLKVRQLVEDVGFEPLDGGPLLSARLLEPFALLWITSAYKFGLGREFAFGLMRR